MRLIRIEETTARQVIVWEVQVDEHGQEMPGTRERPVVKAILPPKEYLDLGVHDPKP
jgi:hypothetical protein